MSTLFYDQQFQPAVRLGTADCSDNSNGATSRLTITNNATAVQLPPIWCPYPTLQQHGYIDWVVTGQYTTTGAANAPTITFTPRDNQGAVTGSPSAMAFTPGAGANTTVYYWLFEARLAVLSDNFSGLAAQVWRGTFTVINSTTQALLSSATAYAVSSMSILTDHTPGFSMTISNNANDPSGEIQSIVCTHTGQRGGS